MLRNRLPFLIEFNELERVILLRVDGYQITPIENLQHAQLPREFDNKSTFPVVVSGLQTGLTPWLSCWLFTRCRPCYSRPSPKGWNCAQRESTSTTFASVTVQQELLRFNPQTKRYCDGGVRLDLNYTMNILLKLWFSSPLDLLPPSFHGLGIQYSRIVRSK